MKILIAEDELITAQLLEILLRKWGHEVVVVNDGEKAWSQLQQPDAPQLAILDWVMPGMDGIDVCRRLRASERTQYTYLILLSAKREKEDIVAGLEAGADDYITKPYHAEELHWRIRIGQRILDLENRLQRKLARLANMDSLTGVLTRRAFLERLTDDITQTQHARTALGVFLLELDHFAVISEDYGAMSGDLVLQDVAERLQQLHGPRFYIGRYASQAFIACCPDLSFELTADFAREVCAAIGRMQITLPGQLQSLQVTASIGVSGIRAGTSESVEALLGRLENGVREAKSQGGNHTCTIVPLSGAPNPRLSSMQ